MDISSKYGSLIVMAESNKTTSLDPIAIGKRLLAIREAENLQSGDFARSIGVDPSSYSKIEHGNKALNMEMGNMVAETYGVTMDFIYRGRLTDLPEKIAEHLRQKRKGTDE